MRLRPKITPLPFEEAQAKLERMGQGHLLNWWETLDHAEKEHLLIEITLLDEALLDSLRHPHVPPPLALEPFPGSPPTPSLEDRKRGHELIASGKCACLVLAGGSGSRLRSAGPKGCFPVTPIRRKSLYQVMAEKVRAASNRYGRPLEVAIMTSPQNHLETETFFAQHAFFGLRTSQIHFFYQEMWPLLDMNENLFLETRGRIALGPNGNGGALERLAGEGIFERWKELGIEHINLVLIDNPLADPFDPEFFGFHSANQNDVTLKVIERKDPEEHVGILAEANGKLHVLEYSELKGDITSSFANLSLYCFSMDFIEKVHAVTLPIHRAKKCAKWLTPEGTTILPEMPNAWKCERFIFDVLPHASKAKALLYPRERCFAPLKNLHGDASITTVQAALQAADREAFAHLTGVIPPGDAHFELAAEFHYPTDALKERWKGKQLPHVGYIEAD